MQNFTFLEPIDLLIATVLVVAAGTISVLLRLGLERSLAIAATRCVLQLGMVGLVLEKIFGIDHPLPVLAWLAVMIALAGKEAVKRARWNYRGITLDAVITMTFSAMIVGAIVTQAVIRVRPWYNPQYVIPLLGMILGNSLNGISLCLDRFTDHITSRTSEIELLLAFGATRSEAMAEPLQTAVKTGMIPIINNMSVAGIVSLPGMMTGQILAGAPPIQAVGYQIVVMFMIAAANALGSMSIASLASRRLMEPYGRLRLDRLNKSKGPRIGKGAMAGRKSHTDR